MDDAERAAEVERLRTRLAETRARQTRFAADLKEFEASLARVRSELGNPFFYSGGKHGRPENAQKTVVNYTGYKSHEPALALLREGDAIKQEIETILDQLRSLGAASE